MRRYTARSWPALVGGALIMAILSALVNRQPSVWASVVAALAGTIAGMLAEDQGAARAKKAARPAAGGLHRDAGGRLPVVRDLDDPVALGVHPAALPREGDGGREPSFVRRDLSDSIERAIKESGFVLIVGASTAGKSRAAYEAIHACLPDHRVVYPLYRAAFPAAVRAARRERLAVLWLDDLERYVDADEFNAQTFRMLLCTRSGAVKIVATLRARERAAFSPQCDNAMQGGAEIRRNVREVLALAREVHLSRRWSDKEVRQAAESRDDRLSTAAAHAGRFGVAEYLAAGPQLYQDWQDALSGTGVPVRPGVGGPRAGALVAAAVDTRRAGYHVPLPVPVLRRLHEHYLAQIGGSSTHPEPWEQALEWATEPLYGTSSLLIPGDGDQKDGYLAFDYLPDAVDAEPCPPPIPRQTWNILVEHGGPRDCVGIGRSAFDRAQYEVAETALRKGWTVASLDAAVELACCLGWTGRHRAALDVLDAAIDLAEFMPGADPDHLLTLQLDMVLWMALGGDALGALPLSRRLAEDTAALRGEHDPLTLSARVGLSRCLGLTGRGRDALRLARRTAATARSVLGDAHEVTASATFEVAAATTHLGDFAGALRLWQAALDERIRQEGPDSQWHIDYYCNIAGIQGECGEHSAAKAAAERAVELADKYVAPGHVRYWTSHYRLALYTAMAGDPEGGLRLADRLLTDATRLHGFRHPVTLWCRHLRAQIMYELGRFLQACLEWERLVEDARAVRPQDVRLLLDCRAEIARCMYRLGAHAHAVARLEAVIVEYTLIFGPDNRGAASWRRKLGALRQEPSHASATTTAPSASLDRP
ncbi:tetratricopeptide repeat protein [Sphaerisporangium dianthi]|uniref:Tetratricopeptide repeat protein n=1 Tax=Sphaerisporangium dianthi TaxID=1436120 RepID=A0ABV9CQA1_9ACTN